jgi:hypothetical protein
MHVRRHPVFHHRLNASHTQFEPRREIGFSRIWTARNGFRLLKAKLISLRTFDESTASDAFASRE